MNVIKTNQKKKKMTVAMMAAAFTMTAGMLSGCGSTSDTGASTPLFSTDELFSDAVTVSSTEASSAETQADAASSKLLPAESLRGGRNAAEDENYVYLCSNSVINRYDKKDLSKCTTMYHSDDTASQIRTFCVSNGNLYVLEDDSTFSTSATKLTLVRADGKSEALKTIDSASYSQVRVDKNTLYLTGYTDNYNMTAYTLNDDGTLGTEDTTLSALANQLPEGDSWLQSSSSYDSSYFDPAYCSTVYGKVYLKNDNGDLLEVENPTDSASYQKPKMIANVLKNASVCGMTSKYMIISTGAYQKETGSYVYTYATVDLASGKVNSFATPENNSADFLDYNEEGIYLGNSSGADNQQAQADAASQYTVQFYGFDGSEKDVFNFEKQPSTNLTYNTFGNSGCAFLSGGIYYVRSMDYANCGFARSYAEPATETALGGTPFFDSGLKAAGITLKSESYTKFANDDPKGQAICSVNMTIPQFSGSSQAEQKMNDFFLQQAEAGAADMVKTAQSDYQDYLSYTASAAATADSSDTSGTDTAEDYSYSGFPYQYSSLMTGVTYSDASKLCLQISNYQFTGGAHGNGGNSYYCMDRSTGKQLKLTDLLDMSNADFQPLVIKYLQQRSDANPNMFFDSDVSGTIKDTYKSLSDYNFYLTEKGIGIEFGNYEVAPYAAGPQNIVIPYAEVKMKS